MKHRVSKISLRSSCVRFASMLGLLGSLACAQAMAQATFAGMRPVAQADRVAATPDFGPRTQLSGHLPRWVSAGVQSGAAKVDLSATMHVSIVLRRDAAVQQAFEQLLAGQQTPGSPLYHQWMTPAQVGSFFGPTADDLAAVRSWVASQGLSVDSVSPSRMILEVSGPTGAVASAFRTSFGYFALNGKDRLSIVSEPFVPTALSPVIDSIGGLTDVPVEPTSLHSGPRAAASRTAASPGPELTNTNGTSTSYFITPNDFATIFDINSVYSAGNKGATIGTKAQHIAIIGRSRVAATDISEYASNVGIASYNLNTVIPTTGVDPGVVCTFANASTCATSGDQGEQTLDVDRVIGTAPGAQVDLVVSGTSGGYNGIYVAAAYNVNTLLDPVMTLSYGACEYSAGSSGDALYNTLFSAGAAEGISIFVSSGDSGAYGCAPDGQATTTLYGTGINYICASSYVTCVGGTEFNDTASPSTYWSATNGAGGESAKSYIPEGAWNEPGTTSPYDILASGGGPSVYITKPSWQTGTGVPTDGHRDTPDVAYPAAGHDGYYVCLDYELGLYTSQGITSADNCSSSGGGYFFGFYGTSAAAPGMAGVAALLNARLGTAQGNLNPLLYQLASSGSGSSVFHDTTIATSGVTSCSITVPSMCNNSTPSEYTDSTLVSGGVQGYLLTTGYDEVTGLGSIDVANLLTAAVAAAPSFTVAAQTASLSLVSGATSGNTDTISVASVNSFAGSVALSCTVTSTSGTAAGTCSLSPTSVTLSNSTSTATLTIATTAGTSGTLSVTVTGTSGTLTATSSSITVTVIAPTFTVAAQTASLSLLAGATTGNTDTMSVASVNGFAGSVALGCTVTNTSGTAAGTCSLSPSSVTLSNSTSTATLTIATTPGTSGTLSVKVTGTSGTLTATSSAITVTVIAPTFTVAAQTASLSLVSGATSGNTDSIGLASVNGFAGSVALACTVTSTSGTAAGTCSLSPSSVTLSNNSSTSTLTITTTPGTSGTLSVTVTGTSGTLTATSSAVTVTLTASSLSLSTPAALSFTSGATTGNTTTTTLGAVNGFSGTVTLSCSISSGTELFPPTCAVTPASYALTSGTSTETITIGSTTAQANAGAPQQAGLGGGWRWQGTALAAAMLCLLGFRRRRAFRALAVAVLAAGLLGISGCSSSSGNGSGGTTHGSSAGSYTVTVTATGTTSGATVSTTATTTFALTIH